MATFIAALSDAQSIYYTTTVFAVASGAAIMYDLILNFSQEVDFIWNRRWTIVTILYFVARYSGPVSQFEMLAAILPLNWTAAEYTSIAMASQLSDIVFTTAMQAILLLRAHALCNRSRKVLVFLLVSFVCEIIVIVVVIVKGINRIATGWLVTYAVRIGSVVDADSTQGSVLSLWQTIYRAVELAFDILLLVVALFGSVKHALEVGGWSVSPLVKAMAEDQIVYFVWYAAWQGTSLPTTSSADAGYPLLAALNILFGAFAIIAGPHMVISLRVRDLKTRESTLQTQLSTIQFNPREPIHSSGSRREVDSEG